MPIFASTVDYRRFQRYLGMACERYDCRIHAYALMTNHVHLLITPQTSSGIPRLMQSLGRRYVRYFNAKYDRTGTLFEGRYRASPIDSEAYLLACYRYIEQNPVRASLVRHASDYTWSSYLANALGQSDTLITTHELYLELAPDLGRRQAAYRDLFSTELAESTTRDIRDASRHGLPLGGEGFSLHLEQLRLRDSKANARVSGNPDRNGSDSISPS